VEKSKRNNKKMEMDMRYAVAAKDDIITKRLKERMSSQLNSFY